MARSKSSITKLISIFMLILILIVMIIAGMWGYKTYLAPPPDNTTTFINQTNYINQTITNTTIVGDTGWSVLKSFVIWGLIVGGFIFVAVLVYKLLSRKKLFTDKRFDLCVKTAKERLVKAEYSPQLDPDPKYSDRWYGGSEEKLLAYSFGFVVSGINPADAHISPHSLITCTVDANTLDVFDIEQGRSMHTFRKQLHDRGWSKYGVYQFPKKPDREGSILDVFDRPKPTVSFTEGEEEEG